MQFDAGALIWDSIKLAVKLPGLHGLEQWTHLDVGSTLELESGSFPDGLGCLFQEDSCRGRWYIASTLFSIWKIENKTSKYL